jgi:hypothetical protein
VAEQQILWWLALSPKGSDSDSPNMLYPCPSHASHVRSSRARIGSTRSVSDLVISRDSASCKLRSPILLAVKSRDPETNLEPGRNKLVD